MPVTAYRRGRCVAVPGCRVCCSVLNMPRSALFAGCNVARRDAEPRSMTSRHDFRMPAKDELPGTLQRSPKKAQETWSKTHDAAVESYGEGERAHRTAFSSLKHSFEKVGDHWEPKDEKGPSDPQAARGGRGCPGATARDVRRRGRHGPHARRAVRARAGPGRPRPLPDEQGGARPSDRAQAGLAQTRRAAPTDRSPTWNAQRPNRRVSVLVGSPSVPSRSRGAGRDAQRSAWRGRSRLDASAFRCCRLRGTDLTKEKRALEKRKTHFYLRSASAARRHRHLSRLHERARRDAAALWRVRDDDRGRVQRRPLRAADARADPGAGELPPQPRQPPRHGARARDQLPDRAQPGRTARPGARVRTTGPGRWRRSRHDRRPVGARERRGSRRPPTRSPPAGRPCSSASRVTSSPPRKPLTPSEALEGPFDDRDDVPQRLDPGAAAGAGRRGPRAPHLQRRADPRHRSRRRHRAGPRRRGSRRRDRHHRGRQPGLDPQRGDRRQLRPPPDRHPGIRCPRHRGAAVRQAQLQDAVRRRRRGGGRPGQPLVHVLGRPAARRRRRVGDR